MAESHPTLRYVERGGTSVLEVGGTWTVFSMQGLRQRIDKARRGVRGGDRVATSQIDATGLERVDTAGALEILQLAGAGPDTEVQTAEKGHADLFKVVQENMCSPPKPRHVDWVIHWLEELG